MLKNRSYKRRCERGLVSGLSLWQKAKKWVVRFIQESEGRELSQFENYLLGAPEHFFLDKQGKLAKI